MSGLLHYNTRRGGQAFVPPPRDRLSHASSTQFDVTLLNSSSTLQLLMYNTLVKYIILGIFFFKLLWADSLFYFY